MKRLPLLLLSVILCIGLLACSSRKEQPESTESTTAGTSAPTEHTAPPATTDPALFTFPKGTAVFGVSLEGLRPEEGLTALKKAVSDYTLTVSAGEDTLTIPGKDLKLQLSEKAYDAWAAALEDGRDAAAEDLLTFAPTGETADFIAKQLTRPVSNATVAYSAGKEKFVPVDAVPGRRFDGKKLEPLVKKALLSGSAELAVDKEAKTEAPSVTASSPAVLTAAKKANRYLELSLTYTYTPEGRKTAKRAVSREELASFVQIGEDFSVSISDSGIADYASLMAGIYNMPGHVGVFPATGGGTIGYDVDYYGQALNQSALAADIRSCLEKRVSGVREAPFHPIDLNNQLPYGGNYVEIDLSAQHLWVYRDNERVVSTDLVSGCVAEGYHTPTGIFSVQDRDTDATLAGEDYETHVDYWIGFYGGYGIHDAPWRWAFGEDIYLYNGSHGCANLPPYQAALVHENTTLGMKVIVYGGETEVDPLKQEIICQDHFDVADDAKPFRLGAKLRYEDEDVKISYKSSNPKVAEVSENGQVTVKGIGKATITLTSPAFTYHTAGKLEVTVNVHSACDEGRHQFGKWTVTKEATCLPGEETRTCSKCGETETREIPPAADHTWGEWIVTKEPTCLPGEETRTCSVCGKTETREIPPTGEHTFGEWVVTKEPTCLPGEETRTCSVCGQTETREIPPTGEHVFGDWITVTEPGCETPGLKKAVCTLCGEEKTEEIPPTGHDFAIDEEFCRNGCGTRNPFYLPPALPHWFRRKFFL